ncbi:MAG: hypothetical protein JWM58_4549 [Rhizobium sp.]|nr:hypothetical protein [Rhizobium sp.]
MMAVSIRIFTLFLLFSTLCFGVAHAEGRRVALVVGNNQYDAVADLSKAANDAHAVGAALKEIGFDVVIEAIDVNRAELNRKISEFADKVEEGDTAFFFYAGHGVAVGSVNYLLPTDFPEIAPNEDEDVVLDEARSADAIIDALQERKPGRIFMILDACRENPFKKIAGRSIGRSVGLVNEGPPGKGVFMLFSAGGKQVALDALSEDDPEPNSVFTRKLIPLLKIPGMSQVKLAKTLQIEVAKLAKTVDHDQTPSYYDEIPGEVYLNGPASDTVTDASKTETVEPNKVEPEKVETVDKVDKAETVVRPNIPDNSAAADWDRVKSSSNALAIQAFIDKYANDKLYRALGEKRLALLIAKPDLKVEEKVTGFRPNVRSATPVARECYGLAGEPGSEPGLAGVAFADIQVRRAIDVCTRAAGMDPRDSMLSDMVGRAHDISRNYGEARHWYQKAVDLGNSYAYSNMAWLVIYGNGEPKDMQKGMRMLEEAADAGNSYAQASLGWIYREGYNGIPRDYQRSLDWYTKAAERDYANAQAAVAWFYREGIAVQRDPVKSLELYRKAAFQGDVNAIGSLGYALQNGLGTNVNFEEARYWYEKGVERNDGYSLSALAWLYREGRGVGRDYGRAIDLYRRAAEKNDVTGMSSLGYMAQYGLGMPINYLEAIRWYEKAAALNDAYSLTSLGWLYREAVGVPHDYARSLEYYRKAAALGDLNAMGSIGYALQNGLGAPVNFEEARVWYERAAEKNDAYSMGSLAWLYENGRGVRQDYSQAKYWYERAANAGNTFAMGNLSLLVDKGLGTNPDPAAAARLAMASMEGRDIGFINLMRGGATSYSRAFRREIQRALKERGYYSGALDGVFGTASNQAIDLMARSSVRN